MSEYAENLSLLVAEHRDELERDLARERVARMRAALELDSIDRRIALLSSLLTVGDDETEGEPPAERLSLHAAMVEVLKTAPEHMMRARDLADMIARRGLYVMRDGRPVEAQQIHARVGNYPDLFGKEGTLITLK